MLKDIKIIRGFVKFKKNGLDIPDKILMNTSEIIDDIIKDKFSYYSYKETSRLYTKYTPTTGIATNSADIDYLQEDNESSVRIYSHSRTLDIAMLVDELINRIRTVKDPQKYDGLSMVIDYSTVYFQKHADEIERIENKEEIFDIVVSGDSVYIDSKTTYNRDITDYGIINMSKLTNLLLIDDSSFRGVSNLCVHLIRYHDEYKKKQSINDELFQKLASFTLLIKEATQHHDIYNLSDNQFRGIIELLGFQLKEDYLVGKEGLLRYVNDISPQVVKNTMVNGFDESGYLFR